MDDRRRLQMDVEAAMASAEGRMAMEEMLEGKGEDYRRAFRDGYGLHVRLVGAMLDVVFPKTKGQRKAEEEKDDAGRR